MNKIKILLCAVGFLLGSWITCEASDEVYNGLSTPKIKITIKNDSENQLTCLNYQDNKPKQFLYLDGKEKRNYENVDEGEYIGCSISIDKQSSTILNWFNVKLPGVYALSLEQVECKSCKGTSHAWATIVTEPNGKREYNDTIYSK